MKKKLALIAAALVLAMSAVSLTACGGESNNNESSGVVVSDKATIADSTDALNQVWNTYAEDEKFAARGGDYVTSVEDAASAIDLADKETVISMLQLPAEFSYLDQCNSVSTLIHMMNTNTFTSAAFELKNPEDADALIEELKNHYPTVHWMCGMPETLMFAKINGGDYVVMAFGTADLVSNFSTKLQTVYDRNVTIAATVSLV